MAPPPPAHTPPHLAAIWAEFRADFSPRIGAAGMEAFCNQVYRARDAAARVTADGSIVADSKGNPCQHPALGIERQAQSEIRQWIREYSQIPTGQEA